MTAQQLGQDDREREEEFLARTMPLPAIDIAGYEPPVPAEYAEPPAEFGAPPADTADDDGAAGEPSVRTTGRGQATAEAEPDLATAEPPRGTAEPPRGKAGAGLRGVARGGVINLAGAVISAASSVALTVIVTRNFSRSVVGTFFVAMSLFLIVEAVTNLGAYNGTIYFIARVRALNAERRIPAIIRATVIPVVIASVISAGALIVFVHPLAGLLTAGQVSQPVRLGDLATMLRVLAVALPFAALADTMLGATRGFHEMQPTVVVDRIGRSTLQLVGVAAAAAGSASAMLAPLWALPYVPAAVIAALWLRRVMREQQSAPLAAPSKASTVQARSVSSTDGFRADNRHGKPNARGFWRFTAPRSLASVAQIVIQRLDIVLVGVLRGPVDAAIYTAATRFLVAGQLGNSAISMAAQPQLTRLFAIKDRIAANTVYQVTTAWLVLLTWPIYLLAAVFGPSVLAIFGRSYHAGSTVMLILALAMLVATACGQVDVVLITTGRSTWSLVNGLMAMCVNIGVDLILIPRMGITGAAVGWAAAIVVANIVPLVQVAVVAKVHPFGRGMAAACGLTALSF
ncbi:MAG: polysaccharide biosynthesis C-terminal domain-containing protein, partial [Nocardiopsaceae bacterium]|nr:polysaccharide biosynthesis C-terminal domain-containing protein [Nocardiopsaceae bacterium]